MDPRQQYISEFRDRWSEIRLCFGAKALGRAAQLSTALVTAAQSIDVWPSILPLSISAVSDDSRHTGSMNLGHMIDHELAWIDPQTILDPSMQILSRIQSSVGFPTMADIDFIIARDSILVAAHLLQLAEKIGHGDKRYTELLKVSFSEYPSGVAAARLSEAMFDSDARDHAESWMAVAVCLRVDAALLHHIGKNRIEKGNGDIARKFLEAAVGRDPHPSTLALLAELAPGLDEKKRLLSDAFHRNSRVDWIACRYAEALFESNESKLARSIVEEILLRNSVYGPAKRLLDRIESES